MILSRFFWLFIGVLIGLLLLIPVLVIGGFLILLIMLITPYLIPLALIIMWASNPAGISHSTLMHTLKVEKCLSEISGPWSLVNA